MSDSEHVERVQASEIKVGDEVAIIEFFGTITGIGPSRPGWLWVHLDSDEGAELMEGCEVLRRGSSSSPDEREVIIERMARAMFESDERRVELAKSRRLLWVEAPQGDYRALARAAFDAIQPDA